MLHYAVPLKGVVCPVTIYIHCTLLRNATTTPSGMINICYDYLLVVPSDASSPKPTENGASKRERGMV